MPQDTENRGIRMVCGDIASMTVAKYHKSRIRGQLQNRMPPKTLEILES